MASSHPDAGPEPLVLPRLACSRVTSPRPRGPLRAVLALLALAACEALAGARSARAACEAQVVACGAAHSFAIREDGTLWAWGENLDGQLGVVLPPPQQESAIPVLVNALASLGVRAVSAGSRHSLAIASDGTVWAWGRNTRGQLGNGTLVASAVPVQVPGLMNAVSIAAGSAHSLAVLADGSCWAWGANTRGQCGVGQRATDVLSPEVVVWPTGTFVKVVAGVDHSLGLLSTGDLWAWGTDRDGQLGLGLGGSGEYDVAVPVMIPAVTDVAAGAYHSLAILPDGTLWAWGDDTYRQLGRATGSDRSTPGPIPGLPAPVVSVAGGADNSVAVLADGRAMAWGYGEFGALGNGITTTRPVPVAVAGVTDAGSCAAGGGHVLLALASGEIRAFGADDAGSLGDGLPDFSETPVAVGITASALGRMGLGFLAVGPTGAVSAWGYGNDGALGRGGTAHSNVPVTVAGTTGIAALPAETTVTGYFHALVLRPDRGLDAWGLNEFGQVGDASGTTWTFAPVRVVEPTATSGLLSDVTAIAANYYHSLAVTSDGAAWAWGYNFYGALSQVGGDVYPVPVRLLDPLDPTGRLTSAAGVAAGTWHSLIVKVDGSVWGTGYNATGQLGNGTVTSSIAPVQALGIATARAVAAGQFHSVALLQDGSLMAWGSNTSGQVGDGTTTRRTSPVPISAPATCTAIAAGDSFTLALTSAGNVLAWGSGSRAQTGTGDRASQRVPVFVLDPADPSGRLSGVVEIAAGAITAAARKADGSVWTWGSDLVGQLGVGTWGHASTPARVLLPATPDQDLDAVPDACDNCPSTANPSQADADLDGEGDVCDACTDTDGDGFGNPGHPATTCALDNCPTVSNDQSNQDGDTRGDACDPCPADPADACLGVSLLRNAMLASRTLAFHASVFAGNGNPALDPVRDLFQAGVDGLAPFVVPGDGLAVGAGNPGVLVFYEVSGTPGPLSVRRSGSDVVLAGW